MYDQFKSGRVFVSYSRRDLDQAKTLVELLKISEFDAFLDLTDIAPGEPWKERLAELISQAHTVLFLLSPESARSDICSWEVDEAERQGKRILPILIRSVDGMKVPAPLARLNYIQVYTDASNEICMTPLIEALETNLPWVREHARIATLAQEWEVKGRQRSELLRGNALFAAEKWISERPDNVAEPTRVLQSFVSDARRAANFRQRATTAFSLFGLAIALIGIWYINEQRLTAIEQRAMAELAQRQAESAQTQAQKNADTARKAEINAVTNQSAALAALSKTRISVSPTEALKLGLAAWPRNENDPIPQSPAGLETISAAFVNHRELHTFRSDDSIHSFVMMSPDEKYLLTMSDKNVTVWDVYKNQVVFSKPASSNNYQSAFFTVDGSYVVANEAGGPVTVLDPLTGNTILSFIPESKESGFWTAFSKDGARVVFYWPNGISKPELWDLSSKKLIRRLNASNGKVVIDFFDNDSRLLISDLTRNISAVFSAETGEFLNALSNIVSVVDNSNYLTFQNENKNYFFDYNNINNYITLDNGIFIIDQDSGNRKYVVSADNGNTTRIHDMINKSVICTLDPTINNLASIDFSPDYTKLLTTSEMGELILWDLEACKQMYSLSVSGSGSISPAGNAILTTTEVYGKVAIWDIYSGLQIGELGNSDFHPFFSKNGDRVWTSSQGVIRHWDVQTGMTVTHLEVKGKGAISSAFLSNTGSYAITKYETGNAYLWDMKSKRILQEIQMEADLIDVEFSNDLRSFSTKNSSHDTTVWLKTGGGFVNKYMLPTNNSSYMGASSIVRFDKNGYLTEINTVSDRIAVRYSSSAGYRWADLRKSSENYVIEYAEDGSFNVRNYKTGKYKLKIGSRGSILDAAISSDSKYLIANWATDSSTYIWELDSEKLVASIENSELSIEYIRNQASKIVEKYNQNNRQQSKEINENLPILTRKPLSLNGYIPLFSNQRLEIGSEAVDEPFSSAFYYLVDVISGQVISKIGPFFPYVLGFVDGNRQVAGIYKGALRTVDISELTKGDLIELACARLPDHDLSSVASGYGLTKLQPICEEIPPKPVWQTIDFGEQRSFVDPNSR